MQNINVTTDLLFRLRFIHCTIVNPFNPLLLIKFSLWLTNKNVRNHKRGVNKNCNSFYLLCHIKWPNTREYDHRRRNRGGQGGHGPHRLHNLSIGIRFLPYKSILLGPLAPTDFSAFLRSWIWLSVSQPLKLLTNAM